MAKGASKSVADVLEDQETLVKTSDPPLGSFWAGRRVLEIQTKLHRWAGDDPHRRFDDLFNLVADPAFLLVAWDRVRGNKGARTPGVDGATVSIRVPAWLGGRPCSSSTSCSACTSRRWRALNENTGRDRASSA